VQTVPVNKVNQTDIIQLYYKYINTKYDYIVYTDDDDDDDDGKTVSARKKCLGSKIWHLIQHYK